MRHELISGSNEWNEYWTVNGLAAQVGVKESVIYGYIYNRAIPTELTLHEPNTGIYLFQKDYDLVERLKKRFQNYQKKRKTNLQAQ